MLAILYLKEKQNGIKQKGFKIMKRYRVFLSIFLSAILTFSMYFSMEVNAQDGNSNAYSYQWKEEVLVSGSSGIERTFYVAENMICYNFVLSLYIKQSPTLIKDISSLSVSVNNTKVYSITMDKVQENGQITVKIPEYLIKKGTNSIVVNGFLKSTKEKCEINNDINWFVVERNSSFRFDYKKTDSKNISGIFESTYYSDGVKSQVMLALPQELAEHNYSQVASLGALTGFIHKNKENKVTMSTLNYSQLLIADRETIVVGTVTQLKAFNNTLLTEEQWQKAEESGYIAVRRIGNKNHFIIITSKEEQLEVLCKILGNKSSLSQIKETDYVLDKEKIINEEEFNTNPSLKALGYEDLSQSGNGAKEFSYYFTIPAKKVLTENNRATFVYNYSQLAENDNGYVTVEVNGEKIMSKELDKGKVKETLEFTIPEKYFHYTGFNISLKFNLKPSVERCTAQSYDNVWISVDSVNSNFKLEVKEREKYFLLNSQGILQNSNGSLDGRILVDSYKNLAIDNICEMSSYLGQVSQGVNNLDIKEMKSNEKPSGIILGLTSSPIIKGLSDNLRIPISSNSEFVNKDLFIQNTSSLGAIEVALNGENLVIMGTDVNQLNNAMNKYLEITTDKDTVIIVNDKIIDTFQDEKVESNKNLEVIKVKYDILLALLALLGASIVILIVYYKKVR